MFNSNLKYAQKLPKFYLFYSVLILPHKKLFKLMNNTISPFLQKKVFLPSLTLFGSKSRQNGKLLAGEAF
jgi:hypothetical protein